MIVLKTETKVDKTLEAFNGSSQHTNWTKPIFKQGENGNNSKQPKQELAVTTEKLKNDLSPSATSQYTL